ncbi:hypothetical protein EVAR_62651_1, partial [Eumeta japonica]
ATLYVVTDLPNAFYFRARLAPRVAASASAVVHFPCLFLSADATFTIANQADVVDEVTGKLRHRPACWVRCWKERKHAGRFTIKVRTGGRGVPLLLYTLLTSMNPSTLVVRKSGRSDSTLCDPQGDVK